MDARKRLLVGFFMAGLMLAILILPVRAQSSSDPGARDPVFEQEILNRLEAINPLAVPVFERATENIDGGDFSAARAGFEKVLELASDFPDALRRLSSCELTLGLYQDALEHAQRAYDLQPSAYNASVLADVLVSGGVNRNDSKALSLAKQAIQEIPDDPYANYVLLFAAANAGDRETLHSASENLLRLVPDNPLPHYFYGLVAAEEGRWELAEAELLKAKELGMPAEEIDQVLKESGIATQALSFRLLRWSGYGVAAWLAVMLVLFLLGFLLSQITLKAVRQAQSSHRMEPSAGEKRMRSIYRAIIILTSFYFYISIPFVILVVIGATAGIFYLFFALGSIPLRLAIWIGLAALYTLFAVVRSIFTRIKSEEPGRNLSESEAPDLWRLTKAVAEKLGTRPIQAIYITPGTEIGVLEIGSMMRKLRGEGRRSLILGMGALPVLTRVQLKAILAHEYGHFTGKDTAGGGLARQVQLSIQNMAYRLTLSGQARWYNPAWLFINGYYRLFLRITHGASRLQEIFADRYAALAYGSRNLIEGIKQIVRQSILFDFQVSAEIKQSIETNRELNNLYTLPGAREESDVRNLAEVFEEALKRPSSAYDTHPSAGERFRLLEGLSTQERFMELDDDRPALELLPNATSLQQEMTERVQANIDLQLNKKAIAHPTAQGA